MTVLRLCGTFWSMCAYSTFWFILRSFDILVMGAPSTFGFITAAKLKYRAPRQPKTKICDRQNARFMALRGRGGIASAVWHVHFSHLGAIGAWSVTAPKTEILRRTTRSWPSHRGALPSVRADQISRCSRQQNNCCRYKMSTLMSMAHVYGRRCLLSRRWLIGN